MKAFASGLLRIFGLFCLAVISPGAYAAWQWAGASQTGNDIHQVIKGGALYVAVGANGYIQTSTDGYGWVKRDSGVTAELYGVAYGNGVYVAVGDSATTLVSADGVTWRRSDTRLGDALPDLRAIAFGNGRFVAVGRPGPSPAFTSTDGNTWTAATVPGGFLNLTSITYADGLFVAAGGAIVTSPDGITWTNAKSIPSFFTAVVHGDGRWVVFSDRFNAQSAVLTSTDGVQWTETSLGQRAVIASAIYDGKRFVAMGTNGFTIQGETASEFVSDDGLAWSPVVFGGTSPITRADQMQSIIQADGRYLAAGWNGIMLYSADAVNWSTIYPYRPSTASNVVYANGQFLAVSGTSVLRSADGTQWTSTWTGAPAARQLYGVTYGNGRYVAVGENQIMYSLDDGVTWAFAATPPSVLYSVVYDGRRFVALGTGAFTSVDGLNWQKLADPPAGTWWTRGRYINGTYYATGHVSGLYRSTDGVSWSADPAFSKRDAEDIAYHDGLWVVAGLGDAFNGGTDVGALRTSTDGVTWTDVDLGGTAAVFYGVMWNHDRWVAVGQGNGSDGLVGTSTDGRTWTLTVLPMKTAKDVAGNDDVEVAVGSSGIARNVFYADTSGTPAAIRNISVRANAAGSPVILGLSASRAGRVLLRGAGPALLDFGVDNAVSNVTLTHYGADGAAIASNDGWGGNATLLAAFHQVGAFDFKSVTSRDAALISSAGAGGSTVHATSSDHGVVLVEAYSLDDGIRFTNLSARNQVGSGTNVLVLGFSIAGGQDERVLIRVVGPGLAKFGVTDALTAPQLQLFRGTTLLSTNAAWGGTPSIAGAFRITGAFDLDAGSNDAAIVTTLPPGSYTVVASGLSGESGSALAEVYELP